MRYRILQEDYTGYHKIQYRMLWLWWDYRVLRGHPDGPSTLCLYETLREAKEAIAKLNERKPRARWTIVEAEA